MFAGGDGPLDVTVRPETCSQGSIALAASQGGTRRVGIRCANNGGGGYSRGGGDKLSGARRAACSGNARRLAAKEGIRHRDGGDC